MPCTCHHPRRELLYMLAFSVLLALFFIMLGVAVLGVHICSEEIVMVGQALRWDVGNVVAFVGNTFRGGRS